MPNNAGVEIDDGASGNLIGTTQTATLYIHDGIESFHTEGAYAASLVLAAGATALLVGPVAYHRLVFRRGQKESLVRAASVMAIAGLAAVGLAVSAAVLLVTSYVASGLAAALITAFVVATFGTLWFAFPLARRS